MLQKRTAIKTIAYLELIIGSLTLVSLIILSLLSASRKPLNVFIFVFISSTISVIIGLGLFAHRNWARKTLFFFSTYILLTKVLIFLNLLHFEGEIITCLPGSLKDIVSFLYHSWILLFFNRESVKKIFS